MREALYELLTSFGFPVFLQGTLAKDDPYPDSFFTFWNDSTNDLTHYNNDAIAFVWAFTVYFYSNDPELVNTMMESVRSLLKSNSWNMTGVGYDVPSDEQSHTGRALEVFYVQKNMNGVDEHE